MLERFEFAHEGARLAGTSPMRRAALRLTHVWLACIMLVAGCSAACGSADSQSHVTSSVELIIKTSTNPFFVDIEQGAQERASQLGLQLSVASGTEDGDVDAQIAAINASIERNDRAIMITPSGPAVDGALKRARKAGIFVVALDTKPNDPAAADITFASDNFEAGRLIGAWAAEKKRAEPVVIAMLDLFVNRSVESDFNRDQGFLEGMGIPLADPTKNGDEAPTGEYNGGTYRIACHEATFGAVDQGRTAMQNCLAAHPDVNLVYTINEPAASGAADALQKAGVSATIVSVDGGCNPGMQMVQSGVLGATAQQYPRTMAIQGINAVAAYLENGTRPVPNLGVDMVSTGVSLVTNDPQRGVPSIDVAEGMKRCWGKPSSS